MKNYKIVTEKPFISDEEINSFQNFEGLISGIKPAENRITNLKSAILTATLIGSVIVVMVMVNEYWIQQAGNEEHKKNNNTVPSVVEEAEKTETVLQPVTDSTVTENASKKPAPSPERRLIEQKPTKPLLETQDSVIKNKTLSAATDDYIYVEAEPSGGLEQLYEYFESELEYPEEAIPDSVNGVVLISFVINTDGKPEQIEILKSPGEIFDKEAVRIIENMPHWKPATINGKPINSKLSIPLTFQIQK